MNKYKISTQNEAWPISSDGEIFDSGINDLEVKEMLRSYYKGKTLKYLLHEREKNGLEDLKKARKHLDRLIELEETHDTH